MQAAQEAYGLLIDLPFPSVPANATLEEVRRQAEKYVLLCQDMFGDYLKTGGASDTNRNAIHIMGEFTFVYLFVTRCRELPIPCVASTTERIASENSDGSKTTHFNFVQFRPYF